MKKRLITVGIWLGVICVFVLVGAGIGSCVKKDETDRFEKVRVDGESSKKEGYDSYLLGLPVESCPYSSASHVKREAWIRGWQSGFLEFNKKGK